MREDELLALFLTTLLTLLVGIIISVISHFLALVRDKRRERLSQKEQHKPTDTTQ